MILIHRLTPLLIALAAAAGFASVSFFGVPTLAGMGATFLAVALLGARLCRLNPRSFQFWYLVGTPTAFLASSFGFLLLLERPGERLALGIVSSLLLFLFYELVFAYVHLPGAYQAYSIEHLSLALNVLTMFFLSAIAFGAGMLLQLPLWMLSAVFAGAAMFVVYGTLWVSKVTGRQALAYALAGTALATELFAVVTYLPTGYHTDAALMAVYLYVFLGLTRARFLDKLSGTVVRRYAITGVALVALIVGTARWV